MLRSYKYRLYPTKPQRELCAKHFGAVRFIYNKGLEETNKIYRETGKKISRFSLQKKIITWRETEYKWLEEVSAQSLQGAFLHLEVAFSRFFKKKGKFPSFKKKSNKQSFPCPQRCLVNFDKKLFYCTKFREGIKTNFSRRFEGAIKTCTISKTPTNKYFVSILVDDGEEPPKLKRPNKRTCLGIDLGIKDFATFSNGEKIANPKFLNRKLKKLRRLSQSHSRKKRDSKNREKSRRRLALCYEKVTNCRKDFQHKLSTKIADNQSYNSVAMETLDIQGMSKNKTLARYIKDAAWFQFKTFLKYKLEAQGKSLIEIDRFAPSSKTCSCGHVNQALTLKDRVWTCKTCNVTHDREFLAANNIKKFAFSRERWPRIQVSREK